MKANLKIIVPALAAATALSACGMFGKDKPKAQPAPAPVAQQQQQQVPQVQAPQTVQVDSIDGKKEVAYKCGNKGQNPLNVMYGFKNGEVVVAQVKYQNRLSPGLMRVVGNDDQNIFAGGGITWAAGKATAANVDKVDGNMLTQEAVETVNGRQQQVSQIVTRSCLLDKAGTAKLNKAAAPAKAAKKAPAKK
ncbi:MULTISPECIES: hypothetical protein [unclassified Neisseria]|uniref:hypothetical protein n=1 Tax=unclassified Neisseria TaxID=2623750 RepID=UPI0010722F22|nr:MULTISPECIES: hypothetical protein [unclassified Neisseria]MBF0803476.1 hypothetical protein [Neisseria sp. 19428wB4_WF04]TFU43868.1 hypothetical protein E4T99_03770 [Neisseria sp. WF04]